MSTPHDDFTQATRSLLMLEAQLIKLEQACKAVGLGMSLQLAVCASLAREARDLVTRGQDEAAAQAAQRAGEASANMVNAALAVAEIKEKAK